MGRARGTPSATAAPPSPSTTRAAGPRWATALVDMLFMMTAVPGGFQHSVTESVRKGLVLSIQAYSGCPSRQDTRMFGSKPKERPPAHENPRFPNLAEMVRVRPDGVDRVWVARV